MRTSPHIRARSCTPDTTATGAIFSKFNYFEESDRRHSNCFVPANITRRGNSHGSVLGESEVEKEWHSGSRDGQARQRDLDHGIPALAATPPHAHRIKRARRRESPRPNPSLKNLAMVDAVRCAPRPSSVHLHAVEVVHRVLDAFDELEGLAIGRRLVAEARNRSGTGIPSSNDQVRAAVVHLVIGRGQITGD